MALTLQITSKTLNLDSETITIFAPSDFSFVKSGQLSLLLLQCHISPVRLDQDSLKTLGFGSRIPTLSSNHSLIVTTADQKNPLSINGVLIQESPIFDEVDLVIYGTDEFFNSSFQVMISSPHSAPEPVPAPVPVPDPAFAPASASAPAPAPSPSLTTKVDNSSTELESSGWFNVDVYSQASDWLNSRGYTVMATFLDMQLVGIKNQTRLTIFAPVDEAMETYVKNITDYVSIFRQHIVPRLLQWQDLIRLEDGAMLPTCAEGFMINVTRSGDVIVVNAVPVVFPAMYSSNWLVVHGLNNLLVSSPLEQKEIGESFSELDGEDYQYEPDYA